MEYLNDVSRKDCVGKVCKSKSSGDFKVLKYNDTANVEIQFLKTGYETTTTLGNIRKGEIKDRYSPSVYGVGLLGNKYPSKVNGRNTKEYVLWTSMLKRCYSDAYKSKYPTYEGCKVSGKFKSYEYFYEWCHNQIGFGVEGWQLDKDLLVKGNKVYSEDSCVFLPQEINQVLTKSTATRGGCLIGVSWDRICMTFKATVSKNKEKQQHLGFFKTELEAFNAYKQTKENYIKELANNWKGKIDERAYEALMNYTVGIDD